MLAVSTGMRQGELLGLRWRDVDFTAAAVNVRHSLQRIDCVFQLVEPKSAKSRRVIAIGDEDVAALRRHRARQAEESLESPGTGRTGTLYSAMPSANPWRSPISPIATSDRCSRRQAYGGPSRIRTEDRRIKRLLISFRDVDSLELQSSSPTSGPHSRALGGLRSPALIHPWLVAVDSRPGRYRPV